MERYCLFCLDPIQENPTPNPIGCQCKIQAHQLCFQRWFEQKNQIECPICHTVSVPNRVAYDNIHIVYIDMTRQRQEEERYSRNQKCAGICCLICLAWPISLTIVELILGR